MGNNILVLGAGELGTSILTALSQLSPPGTKISVLLRPQTISSTSTTKISELAYLKSLDVTFVPGEISSPISELAQIFKSYDLVISCLGYASGPGSQVKITQAVLEAKVKRYIPWQFGADYDAIGRGSAQPVWDEQLDVRDLLRGQGQTEWIIVSTGIFMSFLFEPFFGVVDLGRQDEGEVAVRALGSWENTVTVTTSEDIGQLTAMIVFSEPRIGNEVVFVAGETVSYGRVSEIVERVTGKKVERELWTVEFLKKQLVKDPDNLVSMYRVVFAEGKGVSWDLGIAFNAQKGISVTDVQTYAMGRLVQK